MIVFTLTQNHINARKILNYLCLITIDIYFNKKNLACKENFFKSGGCPLQQRPASTRFNRMNRCLAFREISDWPVCFLLKLTPDPIGWVGVFSAKTKGGGRKIHRLKLLN